MPSELLLFCEEICWPNTWKIGNNDVKKSVEARKSQIQSHIHSQLHTVIFFNPLRSFFF